MQCSQSVVGLRLLANKQARARKGAESGESGRHFLGPWTSRCPSVSGDYKTVKSSRWSQEPTFPATMFANANFHWSETLPTLLIHRDEASFEFPQNFFGPILRARGG